MIATDDPDLIFLPGERYILRELSALPVGELSSDAALRSGLIALTRRAMEFLEMMAEGLAGREPLQEQVVKYILHTYPDADIDAVQANMGAAGVGGMEAMMGTIAEALMERGKAEGLELGKAEGLKQGEARGLERGKAEILTRIMDRRFGPLSSTVRDRIAAAGPDELDAWLDRVLDADSPEEVFDGSGRH